MAILAVGLAIFAEVNRREAQTRDLAVTHMKLANAYLKDSQPSEARDAFKSARGIEAALVEAHPDVSQFKQDLAWVDQQLAALGSTTGSAAP